MRTNAATKRRVRAEIFRTLRRIEDAGYKVPDAVKFYGRESRTIAFARGTQSLHFNYRLMGKYTPWDNELTVAHEMAHIEAYRRIAKAREAVTQAKTSTAAKMQSLAEYRQTQRALEHHKPGFWQIFIEICEATGLPWEAHNSGSAPQVWAQVKAKAQALKFKARFRADQFRLEVYQHAAKFAKGDQIALAF